MIEVAGVIVSGIGLMNDLLGRYKDMTSWRAADLLVDREWVDLARSKGVLQGRPEDYRWVNEGKVASNELKGTHQVVLAFDEAKRTKYRIVRGKPTSLVLMKKL